jgi:iron complex outermembrane recepter protein
MVTNPTFSHPRSHTPMQAKFIFLVLSALYFKSYSQNSVKGTVTDTSQVALQFCPMVLLKASDSSQVKGNLSDSEGAYVFEGIKPGKYFIKFNAVGYEPATSAVFDLDSASRLMLPPQVLGSNGVNLKEVTVQEYKPTIEFKKGIVVMNVENDILSRGNSVLDLLKRLPGVNIDPQNNITINGATGARFLIDDRLQQIPETQVIDMLAGMSADLVSKIELIKNPPARYDAAGTGGLINIVTKRAKVNGYNGSVGFTASQGKRLRWGPNGSFSYKANKLSFFSNFSYAHNNNINDRVLERTILAGDHTEAVNSYGTAENIQRMFSGTGGAEYDLGARTIAGLYFNGGSNDDLYTDNMSTTVLNSTFFNYDVTDYQVRDKRNGNSPVLNFSLLHKLDTTGGQVKLSLGYSRFREIQSKKITNHFYDERRFEVAPVSQYDNFTDREFNVYTTKLDFNKTFRNKFALESGLSVNLEDDYSSTKLDFSNQSTGFFLGDTTFRNDYKFDQRLLGAYSTVSRNWDRFGFSAGLRAEETDVHVDFISNSYLYNRKYLTLFPSGSLDFNINKKNSVTMAYSYRLRRPRYGMLNPVRQYNEQLHLTVGNPEIRPQFTHNFNLEYDHNQVVTVSAGRDETKDFTFWYTYTPEGTRFNIDTFSNLPRFTNTYISLSARKKIRWYRFQTYSVLTRQTFEGQLIGQDVSSEALQLYFNVDQEFFLPKNWKIQVWAGRGSAIRHGPQVYLPRGAVHISVNKSFLDQKLNVTLGLNDVFYTDYFNYTSTYADQSLYMKFRQDSRRVRLSVNYRFGKMQIQQRLKADAEAINPGR